MRNLQNSGVSQLYRILTLNLRKIDLNAQARNNIKSRVTEEVGGERHLTCLNIIADQVSDG